MQMCEHNVRLPFKLLLYNTKEINLVNDPMVVGIVPKTYKYMYLIQIHNIIRIFIPLKLLLLISNDVILVKLPNVEGIVPINNYRTITI